MPSSTFIDIHRHSSAIFLSRAAIVGCCPFLSHNIHLFRPPRSAVLLARSTKHAVVTQGSCRDSHFVLTAGLSAIESYVEQFAALSGIGADRDRFCGCIWEKDCSLLVSQLRNDDSGPVNRHRQYCHLLLSLSLFVPCLALSNHFCCCLGKRGQTEQRS